MAFLSRVDKPRIYVLRIDTLDNEIIYKVGMCNTDRVTDRMMEILRSWFCSYRYVPTTKLLLNINCVGVKNVEAYLHSVLQSNRYAPKYKTDGCTEMFVNLDETRLLWFVKAVTSSYSPCPPVVSIEASEKLKGWLALQ